MSNWQWSAAILVLFAGAARPSGARSVRIGVDQAAPYQSWVEGPGAVGFSVDVVSAAAGARGINLHWVNCPEGPHKAIAGGKVDVWPLIPLKAARDSGFYTTQPWLQNQYAVIWRGNAGGRRESEPDWKEHTLAVTNLPFGIRLAKESLGVRKLDLTPTRLAAMQHLCAKQAEGALVEVRLVEAMLLDRPAGCESIPLRARVFSELSQPLTIAADSSFRAEAEEIRNEISLMLADGRFGQFVDRWFVFSSVEARSAAELMEQRRRTAHTLAVAVVMALLVFLLAVMYRRARAATREAREASRAKDAFLANVSHEVRTPMNGVVGMAELLLDTPLNAEQSEFISAISESARLQLSILNDILDSAKIEAGKVILEPVVFRPAELLQEVWRAFSPLAAKKGLRLELEKDGSMPAMTGDPLRLRQVLSNLVSNAIKFTRQGEVVIRAECHVEAGQATLALFVRDTGIGIERAAQARIFDKFTQADSSTTRRFGGTGLGLSICRTLVELMGGSIAVESALGVGSQFSLSIPLPLAVSGPAAVASAPVIESLSARHPILVVEDNPINQRVATAMLSSLGLRWEVANDGLEGVDKCLSGEYSAVLMDAHMPTMDGLEATRQIRASGLTLPIIAVTAAAADGDRQEALRAGMDDFLAKPVHRSELAVVLARWVDQPKCVR